MRSDSSLFSYPTIRGQQYELLDWLDNVTFPMESKFSDLDFARRTYKSVVRQVINCGVRILSPFLFHNSSIVPVPPDDDMLLLWHSSPGCYENPGGHSSCQWYVDIS